MAQYRVVFSSPRGDFSHDVELLERRLKKIGRLTRVPRTPFGRAEFLLETGGSNIEGIRTELAVLNLPGDAVGITEEANDTEMQPA